MLTQTFGKSGNGIYGFFGDFRWLSNFELCETSYEGDIYPSVENAYQAAKTNDRDARKPMIEKLSNDEMNEGKRARLFGKKAELRSDWEAVKVDIMQSIVREKFARDKDLADALMMTGNLYLEETNYWGDKFWGVCKGEGENNLGKILMNVREELTDKMRKEKE